MRKLNVPGRCRENIERRPAQNDLPFPVHAGVMIGSDFGPMPMLGFKPNVTVDHRYDTHSRRLLSRLPRTTPNWTNTEESRWNHA